MRKIRSWTPGMSLCLPLHFKNQMICLNSGKVFYISLKKQWFVVFIAAFCLLKIKLFILKKLFHRSFLPPIYSDYRTQDRGNLLHFMLSSCLGEKLHWCPSWLWRTYSGTAGQIQCWHWEKGALMTCVAEFCWTKYFSFIRMFTRMKNLF